jgi:outer membrane protein TolC
LTASLVLALLLSAPNGPPSAAREEASASAPVTRVSLRRLIELAQANYPEMQVVAAEQAGADALESLAFWTRFTPRLTDTTVVGLVPAARGDIFFSPDDAQEIDDLGPFYRFRVDMRWPVYTFGRLKALHDASRAFVASRGARAEVKRAAALDLAYRAYFGWLLADRGLDVLAGVRRDLDEVLLRLEDPEPGDPEAEPLDLLKLRHYRFTLDREEAEARRGLMLAAQGLRELSGLSGDVRPEASDLVALSAPASPDFQQALPVALAHDPELRELALGARARSLYATAARKEGLPQVAIEGRYDIGHASNRDEQDNPFVYDPFNVNTLTAALALRWELNFKQTAARARKEEAEAQELVAKHQALIARKRVDLTETYAHLVEAMTVHEASRRALSTGASWLRLADEGYGLGSASINDLIDGYGAFVDSQRQHLEAVHELNLAILAWRQALGQPPIQQGESP